MKPLRWLKLVYYSVPFGVFLICGGLTAMGADLTAWRWLECLELYLRTQVEQIEERLAGV